MVGCVYKAGIFLVINPVLLLLVRMSSIANVGITHAKHLVPKFLIDLHIRVPNTNYKVATGTKPHFAMIIL
jgi:hypothetical protein